MTTSVCPFAAKSMSESKCPLGYDSGSLKIGRFSCIICRALLFRAARSLPCRHIFCSGCIGKFNDCPLCGAHITGLEEDNDLQKLVDQFIQGHARQDKEEDQVRVVYEDSVLTRDSFLLQHAMRAFQAQNLESAKWRLELCLEDTRGMLAKKGASSELCSQLGEILGLLGDCLRSMGDLDGAMERYAESVRTLDGIANKDAEVVHAFSVSLNKLGDIKYYAGDLQYAYKLYKRALEVREEALANSRLLSSESIDVVVSLAKVADVERTMGRQTEAVRGFVEAIERLEGLSSPSPRNAALEERRTSILEFMHAQAK